MPDGEAAADADARSCDVPPPRAVAIAPGSATARASAAGRDQGLACDLRGSSSSSRSAAPHAAPAAPPSAATVSQRRTRPRSPSPATTSLPPAAMLPPLSHSTMSHPRDRLPPPVEPSDDDEAASAGPSPSQIAPLVCCPCCPPGARLAEPVTLRCGHTLCASHLRARPPAPAGRPPPCPLPTCQPTRADRRDTLLPRIPRSSSVVYIPANVDAIPGSSASAPRAARTDVTVSKVLGVVARAERIFAREDEARLALRRPVDDDDTSDEEDAAGEGAPPPPLIPDRSTTPIPGRCPARSPTPGSPNPRPRKRRRDADRNRDRAASPVPAHLPLRPWFQKELLSELSCEICYGLFYQPVTTPCQHTFCAGCLQRSLDHNSTCPLCREEMPDYAYFQDQSFNKLLLSILLNVFPGEYQDRADTLAAEERNARLDTPVFVGQLSFPGVPTFLHFFEPRYRLMLRRCLESPQHRFGMVMPPRPGTGPAEYGTMLEIRSVQVLPDGRSIVETWGTHRFRIVERGTLDGYMVARIERIDDFAAELPEPYTGSGAAVGGVRLRAPSDGELMRTCTDFLEQLRRGTAPWVVQRLNNTYGPMPADAAFFSFWMALVLPIDEHEKAKLLPIRSPRLRLRMLVHWIEQLNSNWWFTSGCVVI